MDQRGDGPELASRNTTGPDDRCGKGSAGAVRGRARAVPDRAARLIRRHRLAGRGLLQIHFPAQFRNDFGGHKPGQLPVIGQRSHLFNQ